MPNNTIQGVISPIVTAFDREGNVYDQGCRNTLDFQLPHINGFFICGSYGFGALMSADERKHVVEIMTAHINGRAPVIVHAGTTNTRTTVELAKHAQSSGVDAIAVIPPFYYKHGEENIIAHFQTVLDAVDIPVYVYDYPGLSNNPVNVKLLQRLADMGVTGVKFTSSDLPGLLQRMVTVRNDGFAFMVGTEALLLAALSHGAQACISGMSNSLPYLLAETYQAIEQGDQDKMRRMQLTVTSARAIIKRAPGISSAYALMRAQGVDAGYPRMPFLEVSQDMIADTVRDLKELGVWK